ncbi:MAG TPA: HAD hydrolase family protein [Ktedonobacteraceae bacterium]|nr:HAD hydrolase family protein [Ktedonobacteraceae bacterium]
MLHIEIPQWGTLELHHAVFDINGTLAVSGLPIPGAADRLKVLSGNLTIHLLTAGTHGNLDALQETFGFPLHQIRESKDKLQFVQELGPSSVVAFGNGANDTDMLRAAALGIAVMAEEGVAVGTLQAADILINGPLNAIDLLLHPKRLIATLRG